MTDHSPTMTDHSPTWVRIGTDSRPPSWAGELMDAASAACGDPLKASEVALLAGRRAPQPGEGLTVRLWETLASLAAVDLTVARTVEPHLDALAILGQAPPSQAFQPAGAEWNGGLLGVYAAEGPGTRLEAQPTATSEVRLTGVKPWCSLAEICSAALVTAWVDDTRRGLFLVDLTDPSVSHGEEEWVARGLPRVRSVSTRFDDTPARPVGGPGWYLERPGFAWGGIGVAAVWFGGAVALLRRMRQSGLHRDLDQIGMSLLGQAEAEVWTARNCLAAAADHVDAGRATGSAGNELALLVRQCVAGTAEHVLQLAEHLMGPGPLALEETYAACAADLRLYVRQHHAERDAAELGRISVAQERANQGHA
ncbi:acyl-CoA dehydrogenase family protein [soil metagenome]